MTTKVNATKVAKESANKNAKNANVSAKDILAKVNEQTKGLLKTNLGTHKSSVYKESLFAGMQEREKKSLRKKLRNTLLSIANSLISANDKDKKQLINAFNDMYKSVYITNDYSITSICNENLQQTKKDILLQALNICKDSANKNA